MTNHETDPKSCDPQLFDGEPQETWGVDELGVYAEAQHRTIEEGEHSLAANYWYLGRSLSLARPHFSRRKWGKFLEDLKIEKTRAARARAIERTFPNAQALDGMSVQEAYRRRKRKLRKRSTSKRRAKQPECGLVEFMLEICEKVDFFMDEVRDSASKDAEEVLPAIDSAVRELNRLRDALHQRTESG